MGRDIIELGYKSFIALVFALSGDIVFDVASIGLVDLLDGFPLVFQR